MVARVWLFIGVLLYFVMLWLILVNELWWAVLFSILGYVPIRMWDMAESRRS